MKLEGNILICMLCDPAGGFDKGNHKKEHTLLSVRNQADEEDTPEEENRVIQSIEMLESKMHGKLSELEATLGSLDGRLGTMEVGFRERMDAADERMDEKFKAMNDRFTRIELLLEKVLTGRFVGQ